MKKGPAAQQTAKTILVVDDSPMVREEVARILTEAGYWVSIAESGNKAFELFKNLSTDLIVSDVEMPEGDGLAFLRAVRSSQRQSRTPFLFLSSHQGNKNLRQAMQLGANDYLAKPFEPSELLGAVSRALETRKALENKDTNALCLAGVAHDLRAPLTVIMMSAEMLHQEEEPLLNKKRVEYYSFIESACEDLQRGLKQFIGIQKASRQEYTAHLEMVCVPDLIESVVDHVRFSTRASHNFLWKWKGAETDFFLDIFCFRNLLVNLLTNAAKYSSSSSPVEIAGEILEDECVVTVRDYGKGFSDEDKKQAFEAYFRGKDVGAIDGFGLGLYMVRHYASLHGGQVEIKTGKGNGTVFTITLPRKSPPELKSQLHHHLPLRSIPPHANN